MAKKTPKGMMKLKIAIMEKSPKDIKRDMKNGGKETKVESNEYKKTKNKTWSSQNKTKKK